jgi:hypothetical protein
MAGVAHPPTPDGDDGHSGGVMMCGTPAGTSGTSNAIAYLASDDAALGHGTVIDVGGARASVAVISGR